MNKRASALAVLLVPATLFLAAGASGESKPPPPESAKPLFDGKSLDGWTQVPADSWTVKDGAMASLGLGRGVLYTNEKFSKYRLTFTIRHGSGKPDHPAGILIFCSNPPPALDALAGIQFQAPNGGHWDYRKGHNNNGKEEFTSFQHKKFDQSQWSRIELLVDSATGTARMAVAQPVEDKAVEVLSFKDPTAGKEGSIAWQMHNKGLFDEYKDVRVEIDPKEMELITVK